LASRLRNLKYQDAILDKIFISLTLWLLGKTKILKGDVLKYIRDSQFSFLYCN